MIVAIRDTATYLKAFVNGGSVACLKVFASRVTASCQVLVISKRGPVAYLAAEVFMNKVITHRTERMAAADRTFNDCCSRGLEIIVLLTRIQRVRSE